MDEADARIEALASELIRSVRFYWAANGSTRDSLHEALIAIALVHTGIFRDVKGDSNASKNPPA